MIALIPDWLLLVLRFLLPAWSISALALIAAGAVWLVRPMPKYIRLSIIVPLAYFGGLYLLINALPDSVEGLKFELTNLGLALIFLPIIINSVIARIEYIRREGRQ